VYEDPIAIFCDNTSAINISKNPDAFKDKAHIHKISLYEGKSERMKSSWNMYLQKTRLQIFSPNLCIRILLSIS